MTTTDTDLTPEPDDLGTPGLPGGAGGVGATGPGGAGAVGATGPGGPAIAGDGTSADGGTAAGGGTGGGTGAGTGGGTMHIGELAERAGMSLRTIRHYDEVGLLVPSGRTAGGFRTYTEQDLDRLLVIRRMKPLGFSLDEMADLLTVVDGLRTSAGAPSPAPDRELLAARLDAFIADAEARHGRLVERVAMAEEFVGTLQTLRSSAP